MSERKSKNIVIIALCITLIFMGVGYAFLSTTLTINGTATVNGVFDVHFGSVEAATPEGINQGKSTSALMLDNKTLEVAFELVKPGDSVTYTVTVENSGSIDAILNEINTIGTEQKPNAFNDQTAIIRTIKVVDTDATLTENDNVYDTAGMRLAAASGGQPTVATFEITYTLDPTIGNEGAQGMPNAGLEGNTYSVEDVIHFEYSQEQ